jgi:deoxycytidine triphosphate deaminase/predicted NUDIX family phosphoesterase
MEKKGYCLVSQEIRKKILNKDIRISGTPPSIEDNGSFKNDDIESRVQPSSFEPVIGNEAFILDSEEQGVFSPKQHETVYRALLGLPKRQRQKISISGGFEIKTGFSYLIPLEERITLHDGEGVKASPKSSIGRLFPLVRTIADYNPGFDAMHHWHKIDEPLHIWLLVQPTTFNMIIYPGLALNQLRFFNGLNVSLSQQEIIEEIGKNPLLYSRKVDGNEVPVHSIVTDDGLEIKLDLSGEYTSGIVALRARRNPTAIDLSKTGFYNAEEFFEPVENRGGKIKLFGGEGYLMASKGILNIPPHLSSELRRHYGTGMRGTWDEAGFVDPGFRGHLIFEVGINERGGITLSHDDERQISALEFFRVREKPDKLYGEEETGSHYQNQSGPRVSKHFKEFDYGMAAKDYKKLNRDVLVHDAKILKSFRKTEDGFELLDPKVAEKLSTEVEERGFFHSRYDCEIDEEVLQVIPYVLLFDQGQRILTYVRAVNIKDYGDRRLFGKHSFGFGGHIIRGDGPQYINKCLEREVMKEEVRIEGRYSQPKLVGTLMAYDAPVDRVHFGLIYTTHIEGRVKEKESSVTSLRIKCFDELIQNSEPFETWSKILIPHLSALYEK